MPYEHVLGLTLPGLLYTQGFNLPPPGLHQQGLASQAFKIHGFALGLATLAFPNSSLEHCGPATPALPTRS
jgi:hypothetical protein